MKTLLTLSFALLALQLAAQNFNRLEVLTNNASLAVNTTNTVASDAAFVGGSEYLGIELAGYLGGTNGYNGTVFSTLVLQAGVTKTNWVEFMRLDATLAGTNVSTLITYTNVGGFQWVRKSSFEAPGTNSVQGLSIILAPKIIGGR